MATGTSARPMIALHEPCLRGNEGRYLQECVATNFVSSVGPFVTRFEEQFAAYVGSRFAVATSSGTAALHTGLRLLGVGPGDTVLVSTLTFVASVNPIVYQFGIPVFVDAEPETWNLDPTLVVEDVEWRVRRGRPPKVILPVHVLGRPANLRPILDVAARHRIPVLEDAAESLGATIDGRHVGTLGDIGCFSFNGNKTLTSGGGGMLVTDDEALARRARHLTTQARVPGEAYFHDEIGYNYRMTNLQAAVGLAQLEQLPGFLARKKEIAARYAADLADVPGITLPHELPWGEASWWLYAILIDPAIAGSDWKHVLRVLADGGIQSRPLWVPIHMMEIYRGHERLGGHKAEWLFERGLCLPSSAGLLPTDQERVIRALRKALNAR